MRAISILSSKRRISRLEVRDGGLLPDGRLQPTLRAYPPIMPESLRGCEGHVWIDHLTMPAWPSKQLD